MCFSIRTGSLRSVSSVNLHARSEVYQKGPCKRVSSSHFPIEVVCSTRALGNKCRPAHRIAEIPVPKLSSLEAETASIAATWEIGGQVPPVLCLACTAASCTLLGSTFPLEGFLPPERTDICNDRTSNVIKTGPLHNIQLYDVIDMQDLCNIVVKMCMFPMFLHKIICESA